MSNILIAYDTTEGQTREIAERIVAAVARSGHETALVDIRRPPAGFTIIGFDAALVGASIHLGRHSRRFDRFIRRHLPRLAAIRSGFFSVSLSAAGTEKQRADAQRYLDEFLQRTGWSPQCRATFAGGLRYREYGWLKRWIMHRIAREAGRDTDTARNHEYTDWNAVAAFVEEFLAQGEASPLPETR